MNEPRKGFAFPFRIAGHVRAASGPDKLARDMRHLLATRLSERALLRDYGGGLHQRVQEPNDDSLRTLVRYEIEQALNRYLPEVVLTAPPRLRASGSELTITLEYRADPGEAVRSLEFEIG